MSCSTLRLRGNRLQKLAKENFVDAWIDEVILYGSAEDFTAPTKKFNYTQLGLQGILQLFVWRYSE